jgi:hypothetical protein
MIKDHGITLEPRFGQPDEVGKGVAAAANANSPIASDKPFAPTEV